MSKGIKEALRTSSLLIDPKSGQLRVKKKEHYSPGFWVLLAATANKKGLRPNEIVFEDDGHKSYTSAMGLAAALGNDDDYQFERKNEGQNYSRLAHLDCVESTDVATSTINNCIREFLREEDNSFVTEFCEIVGELHDNVWSHGKASGFSMAQKSKVPWKNDNYLEFALADKGLGFLREMKRVGLEDVVDDEAAIDWCIAEGHSTKLREKDEWAQALPEDHMGNPFRGVVEAKGVNENHHQGLGLWKLVEFITKFKGTLWLASGSKLMEITEAGKRHYYDIEGWDGVAVSCRIRESYAARFLVEAGHDRQIEELMNKLSGDL